MAVTLTPTDTVIDDGAGPLELNGPAASATATVNGTTFVYIGGTGDDGISVFTLAADGTLTNVFNVDDASNASFELLGVRALAPAVVGASTYLFAAGLNDNGVSVFTVNPNGNLTHVDSVDDASDADFELLGASSLTTAVIEGITYLFVGGDDDDGISAFSVDASTGALTHVHSVEDAEDTDYQLNSLNDVAIAQVGGKTFLFGTGGAEDGISVFEVTSGGIMLEVQSIHDESTLNSSLRLDGVFAAATAVIAGKAYLYVGSQGGDDAISVFEVGVDGRLSLI